LGRSVRAVGVHQAGVYLGQILGGFAGYAADSPEHGWRWAFSTAGLVGVLYVVPLMAALRDPDRSRSLDLARDVRSGHPERAQRVEGSALESSRARAGTGVVRGLLGNRDFVLLERYFTLPEIAGWIVRDWMPAGAVRRR
jgi:MFS family permease